MINVTESKTIKVEDSRGCPLLKADMLDNGRIWILFPGIDKSIALPKEKLCEIIDGLIAIKEGF